MAGVGITDEKAVALFDDTTGWAFGTTFASVAHAEDFLRWLGEEPRGPMLPYSPTSLFHDARLYDNAVLEKMIAAWRTERVDEDGDLRE